MHNCSTNKGEEVEERAKQSEIKAIPGSGPGSSRPSSLERSRGKANVNISIIRSLAGTTDFLPVKKKTEK